jgi:hypothetical protein
MRVCALLANKSREHEQRKARAPFVNTVGSSSSKSVNAGKEDKMKTLILLFALTVGLVSVTGCHWNHHRHHFNNSASLAWR